MRQGERGESLIGVAVGVGIAVLATSAILAATLLAARRFGPDPVASALERAARSELRVAVDLLKYQGAVVPTASVATTIPLPSASPFPAHLAVATSALPSGAVGVTITATSDTDANERAVLSTTVAAPAPIPSAVVPAAQGGAAPQ